MTLALALPPFPMDQIMGNYAQNAMFQIPAEINAQTKFDINVEDYLRHLMHVG